MGIIEPFFMNVCVSVMRSGGMMRPADGYMIRIDMAAVCMDAADGIDRIGKYTGIAESFSTESRNIRNR